MVGDSAVSHTIRSGGVECKKRTAKKVIYNEKLNVGIACWGHACVNRSENLLVDEWTENFLIREESRFLSIKVLADRFARELNPFLRDQIRSGDSWKDVRAGYHLAGFVSMKPVLYHIHCGHDDNNPFHELEPYYDFPDLYRNSISLKDGSIDECSAKQNKPWKMILTQDGYEQIHRYETSCAPETADPAYKTLSDFGFFHLRNGEISEFVSIWNDRVADTPGKRRIRGIAIDSNDLSKRFTFYIEQLKAVCEKYADRKGEKATIALPLTGVCFNIAGRVDQV